MSEKLTAKEYAEKLLYTPEYAADKQADVKEKAAAFAEGYKKFMDSAKTEREAAVVSEQMLLAAGYKAFEPQKAYAPGEKVYFIQENKAETMENNINQIINLALVGGLLAVFVLWLFLKNMRLVFFIALSRLGYIKTGFR